MQDFLDALIDALLWLPLQVYSLLLDGLAAVISAIPVPDWVLNVSGYAAQIPTTVVYFVQPFEVGSGVAIILSAYGLRFLIRRIPVIG